MSNLEDEEFKRELLAHFMLGNKNEESFIPFLFILVNSAFYKNLINSKLFKIL